MCIKNYCDYIFSVFFICSLLFFSACKVQKEEQNEHTFTNDLVYETSPYLLQHAHNPVDWKAWNEELFTKAKKENKLLLISIGYSSCHWCHVMEKETFEDTLVANLMNKHFISIKVDREERPDVDQVYQTAIQLIGQSGGWPLNVIALPNGKPLYLGTYLPKEQWNEVLSKVNKMYTNDPEKANEYANSLAQGINEVNVLTPSYEFENLTKENLSLAVEKWKEKWDLDLGGNQGNQKFITPNNLQFLLDYSVVAKDKATLKHVKNTLQKIANGGIYDHIGGGFYRYSTDSKWRIPHFEKMLYDNAQIISLYSNAYKVFKEPAFKDIVYETIRFLEREMKHSEGGYYATLNADSNGVEGEYYVWTLKELKLILGSDLKLFSSYYNVEPANAWEENKYVLFKDGLDTNFLKKHEVSVITLDSLKRRWSDKLLKARYKRVRPTIDDKIISSWNSLLIKGYTDAYAVFGDETFLERALSIYNFIKAKSFKNGRLIHSYKKGSKRNEGFLEDYAFLIDASLNLYTVTLNEEFVDFSMELTDIVFKDFSDKESGMFTFNKDQSLISKIIKTNDGDIPSPNSVMAHNLLKLGHIKYLPDYIKQSQAMTTTVLPYIKAYTDGYSNWASLLLNTTHPYFEIVVVGKNAKKTIKKLHSKHLPNTLIVGTTGDSEAPLFKDRFVEDATYIYVCQNSTCKLPVTTITEALEQLQNF